MFSATFFFLGIAGFVVAALACLSRATRAGRCVEVDLAALHSASVCLATGPRAAGRAPATGDQDARADAKAKWQEMKAIWVQWYAPCLQKAVSKQKAMYSWARTLSLCAALSLVGAVLEAHFGESISVSTISSSFEGPRSVPAVPPPPPDSQAPAGSPCCA